MKDDRPERFEHVRALLAIQERDAVRWRDSCVLYFQSFQRGDPRRYDVRNLSGNTTERWNA